MSDDPDARAGTHVDARAMLARLRAALPGLPPSEQRVASFVLSEPEQAAGLTVAELAERTATSTTSVLRCAQRLGYERFRDLRVALAAEATRRRLEEGSLPAGSIDLDSTGSLDDLVAKVARDETLSIADTAATLDTAQLATAIELVDAASRVDAFGIAASSFVCLDLVLKLTRLGRVAQHSADPHVAWMAAATLDERCVAVGVSHSGATVDVVEFLRIARSTGAATIAISNSPDSPLAAEGDVVLTTAARESAVRAGAFGSRIAQLMVVDCLFLGVAAASPEASMRALGRTFDVVQGQRTAAPRGSGP